jgi:hypothetical protein
MRNSLRGPWTLKGKLVISAEDVEKATSLREAVEGPRYGRRPDSHVRQVSPLQGRDIKPE